MSKSRLPVFLGLGAAGGVGYYLYNAGGNAKVAENKFESASSPRLLNWQRLSQCSEML